MLTEAQHISRLDWAGPEFQAALAETGRIVTGRRFPLQAYSRHTHNIDGEVMFEELVSRSTEGTLGELKLYPLTEQEALAKNGLPSTWAFTTDGTPVVLRYADRRLHEGCGIDVTSDEFLAELAEIGRQFVADPGMKLNELVEVTIAATLLRGDVTCETTDVDARTQQVLFGPADADFQLSSDSVPACWNFTADGTPVVRGWCSNCPPEKDDA